MVPGQWGPGPGPSPPPPPGALVACSIGPQSPPPAHALSLHGTHPAPSPPTQKTTAPRAPTAPPLPPPPLSPLVMLLLLLVVLGPLKRYGDWQLVVVGFLTHGNRGTSQDLLLCKVLSTARGGRAPWDRAHLPKERHAIFIACPKYMPDICGETKEAGRRVHRLRQWGRVGAAANWRNSRPAGCLVHRPSPLAGPSQQIRAGASRFLAHPLQYWGSEN